MSIVVYCITDFDKSSVEDEKEQMTSLDTLAAYYVLCARKEKVKEKKKFYFTEVLLWLVIKCFVYPNSSHRG